MGVVKKFLPFNIADLEMRLPKRTQFYRNATELQFDPHCPIEVNWEERLLTNKDRIRSVLGNIIFFEANPKFLKLTALTNAFAEALEETRKIAKTKPRLAAGQAFIDSKRCRYRMELLLPVKIEFPRGSGRRHMFAVAIQKSRANEVKKYTLKSILTLDMAYSNARLLGYVHSDWLKQGAPVMLPKSAAVRSSRYAASAV